MHHISLWKLWSWDGKAFMNWLWAKSLLCVLVIKKENIRYSKIMAIVFIMLQLLVTVYSPFIKILIYFLSSWESSVSTCTCLCFVHRLGLSKLGRKACSLNRWMKTTHHSRSLDWNTGCCDSDALPRPALLQKLTSPATVVLYKVSDTES